MYFFFSFSLQEFFIFFLKMWRGGIRTLCLIGSKVDINEKFGDAFYIKLASLLGHWFSPLMPA